MINRSTIAALALATAAGFLPTAVLASETITAAFTPSEGGVTTGLYDGVVKVTVSGVGQSLGTDYNDAFYVYTGVPTPTDDFEGNYYKLGFSTSALTTFDQSNAAVLSLVGPEPAYNPSHIYTFELNTGTSTPSQLHFGVTDGQFNDNTGAFSITVSSVPEPASWAIMLMGTFVVGGALRLRRAKPLERAA